MDASTTLDYDDRPSDDALWTDDWAATNDGDAADDNDGGETDDAEASKVPLFPHDFEHFNLICI